MRQIFEVTATGAVSSESVRDGLQIVYEAPGSIGAVRDVTSEHAATLHAVKAERDAFVELAAAFLGDVEPLTIGTAIEEFKQCSMRPYNVQWYGRYRRLVQALEDLPQVTS